MKRISYSQARNNLASVMENAALDRAPISITRNGTSSVVLLVQEEYESLVETDEC